MTRLFMKPGSLLFITTLLLGLLINTATSVDAALSYALTDHFVITVQTDNPGGLRKVFSVISFSIHQKLAERLWKCGQRCALAHNSTGPTTAALV